MNRATHINVMVIGVIFGIAGMTHGFGEILQGNTPTGGLFINAIGAGSSWTRWTEGNEGAFTLIPNFLLTGIFAVTVGLAIVIWSLGFVHRAHGPFVFLLLFLRSLYLPLVPSLAFLFLRLLSLLLFEILLLSPLVIRLQLLPQDLLVNEGKL